MIASPGKNTGMINFDQVHKLIPWWGRRVVSTCNLGDFDDYFNNEELVNNQQNKKLKAGAQKFELAVKASNKF